jgi:hypothetical protein
MGTVQTTVRSRPLDWKREATDTFWPGHAKSAVYLVQPAAGTDAFALCEPRYLAPRRERKLDRRGDQGVLARGTCRLRQSDHPL